MRGSCLEQHQFACLRGLCHGQKLGRYLRTMSIAHEAWKRVLTEKLELLVDIPLLLSSIGGSIDIGHNGDEESELLFLGYQKGQLKARGVWVSRY